MKVKLHVVTDADERVQAAFAEYSEALGYVWTMFDPESLEDAMLHIETCDCDMLGNRLERALGKPGGA